MTKPRKLYSEDRIITSLQCVRMRMMDVIDVRYKEIQKMILLITELNDQMDYLERAKKVREKK